MNEEITGKLIEWVEGAAFLIAEEMPSFVTEMTTYGAVSHTIWAVGSLISFVLLFAAGVKLICMYRSAERIESQKEYFKRASTEWMIVCGMACLLFSVGAFSGIIVNASEAAKAIYAPRLYCIDQLRGK